MASSPSRVSTVSRPRNRKTSRSFRVMARLTLLSATPSRDTAPPSSPPCPASSTMVCRPVPAMAGRADGPAHRAAAAAAARSVTAAAITYRRRSNTIISAPPPPHRMSRRIHLYHITFFGKWESPPVSHKGGESYTGLSPQSGAVLMNHEGGIPLVHRKKQFISRRLPAGAREFARQLRGVSVSVCSHAAAGPAPV